MLPCHLQSCVALRESPAMGTVPETSPRCVHTHMTGPHTAVASLRLSPTVHVHMYVHAHMHDSLRLFPRHDTRSPRCPRASRFVCTTSAHGGGAPPNRMGSHWLQSSPTP